MKESQNKGVNVEFIIQGTNSGRWYTDTYGFKHLPKVEDLQEGEDFVVIGSQLKPNKKEDETGLIIL